MSATLLDQGYQGGGPSFAAILRARIRADDPLLLEQLWLDDEGDALRVCAGSTEVLGAARRTMVRLEQDPALLQASVVLAVANGDME